MSDGANLGIHNSSFVIFVLRGTRKWDHRLQILRRKKSLFFHCQRVKPTSSAMKLKNVLVLDRLPLEVSTAVRNPGAFKRLVFQPTRHIWQEYKHPYGNSPWLEEEMSQDAIYVTCEPKHLSCKYVWLCCVLLADECLIICIAIFCIFYCYNNNLMEI